MSGKLKVGDRVVFTRDIFIDSEYYALKGDEGVIRDISCPCLEDIFYEVTTDKGNIVGVGGSCIKAVEERKWLCTGWLPRAAHVTPANCSTSQPPLRINRLLAKVAKDLPPDILSKAESEGRMTGETTGYLLSFLGQVISNPNKWYTIRKSPYGERARNWEMDSLKGMVEMLQLDLIEFRHSDKSVMFKLYEDFNGKYDLYNREVL